MSAWTSGDLVTHGTRLHYYRTGGGKPPLVLLHGVTDDGLCWTPAAEVLAAGYDVVMVDLRGHGKSDAPEAGYTMAAMAAEVAGLVTGLGLDRPIVLGHSMGAVTTLALAGLFPDLPAAILVEDPPAFWNLPAGAPRDDGSRAGMLAWITGIKRKTRAELLADARAENPHWSEAELGPWADAKHRFSPRITALVPPADAITADFPALLRRIRCPALFISGDQPRGAISGAGDIAALRALVPQLQAVHIPDAGHSIRRDQFARYMEAVQDFLAAC